ncbi:hypothetical protein Patl1_00648 [Pistacia atlantica]|uniref:Uncharacterized protein n=1 Tax=Pistacia atlantica TaxID=434234 RepID=A0ACC1CDF2_9ROSI|nr:hypothetical protein Patl1_00648 [Pistacia atlantica]
MGGGGDFCSGEVAVAAEIAMSRPIFVGNFEYETRQSELERVFSKYGRVERVDMKSGHHLDLVHHATLLHPYVHQPSLLMSCIITSASDVGHAIAGFAFVYFEDDRDAADAIRGLDNQPFGYNRRRLSVEWARGERGRHREGSRSMANQRPTKTLFVINFDPIRTKERDIKRHFEPYGNVLHVRIRRNFAFVQFETQEDATKALDATNRSKLLDRVISVEYALKDDSERDDRYDSPRRGSYGRRGDSPYGRSPSPAYRRRPSPDYGRARSPVYDRYNGTLYDRRRSPDYGRNRSPVYYKRRSPDYGRNRSPEYDRYRRYVVTCQQPSADHQLEGQEREKCAFWGKKCALVPFYCLAVRGSSE